MCEFVYEERGYENPKNMFMYFMDAPSERDSMWWSVDSLKGTSPGTPTMTEAKSQTLAIPRSLTNKPSRRQHPFIQTQHGNFLSLIHIFDFKQ